MNTVELRDVRKDFHVGRETVHAVDSLDLAIEPGEIVAFLGPNGAGKTTTIDMMLGLTTPSSGSVRVFGDTPRHALTHGRIGAVMQSGGLLRDLTVRETVAAIAALQRTPKARVDEVLDRANLRELANRKVSKCSGGEQQRIKFALALLTDPDLLILDEPTTGMDVGARRDFWAAMTHEAHAGRTIVFATHYLEEAQDFAQRIVLIGRGRLLADGPVAQVQAMTSGRELEASFDQVTDATLAMLSALPGVTQVHANGNRLTINASTSDDVARYLLSNGAYDLVISAPTLESAFLALTKDAA